MNKAVTVATMRESDAWTIANKIPSKELMRRAGEGIFQSADWKEPIAIVCGSGNNAGDGYVVADLLNKENKDVTIVLLSSKFSEDGKYYFDICKENHIPFVCFSTDNGSTNRTKPDFSGLVSEGESSVFFFYSTSDSDFACNAEASVCFVDNATDNAGSDSAIRTMDEAVSPDSQQTISDFQGFATILDCILGTGFEGEPRDPAKTAINAINNSDAYIISADINSGLNGDTGLGTTYVKSDLTVSIGDYKLGHFKGLADSAMKEKVNVDIGIEIQGDYIWI